MVANAPSRAVRQSSTIEPGQQSVLREVDYIVGRAAEHRSHVVRLRELVLFSTHTGDAWLLDTDDHTALPLARDGDRLPVRILEDQKRVVIEWTHDCAVDADVGAFVVRERRTGQVRTVVGYGLALLRELG